MSGFAAGCPVIIDTCVWVEHVRNEVPLLTRLCNDGRAVALPDIVGELLLGCGDERRLVVRRVRMLPTIDRPPPAQLEQLVAERDMACKRIGWVDAVILCTALSSVERPRVLTFDRRLLKEAIRLGVAFTT